MTACADAVLQILIVLANQRGECSPSMAELVRVSGFSRKSVRRAVLALVARNLLSVQPQVLPDGGCGSNLYTLSESLPQGAA